MKDKLIIEQKIETNHGKDCNCKNCEVFYETIGNPAMFSTKAPKTKYIFRNKKKMWNIPDNF